jgi:hypothetical protein
LLPGNAGLAGRFSGRIRGGPNKNFGDQGSSYTGDIKRKKIYSDQAENYRGFLKAKKQGKFIGSYGHKFWNNNGSPVAGKALPGGGIAAGRFSGRIRGGEKNYSDQGSGYTGDIKGRKEYADQGEGYSGYLKAEKKGKFVGSLHTFWNNRGKSITALEVTKTGALAGSYHGHTKAKEKGKALIVPNKLWNNQGKAVTQLDASRSDAAAGSFQGRTKAKKQEKYPLNSASVMWNNKGKATTQLQASKSDAAAGSYQGRMKAKKQEKYPINSASVMWNNNGKATTQIRLTSAGAKAGTFAGNSKFKKESKHRDADIESRMRLKEQYTQNPHSVDEAIKKQKPELNYKAGNFASGAKVVGKRRHNPNSVDDALDSYHNQASARRIDYQGNVKMRKFVDRRQSPDAKFVHSGENNVKEDRTLFTNMKLLWAKLFQKSDSQPSNLKERSNKLRYDKGEKGLWAD